MHLDLLTDVTPPCHYVTVFHISRLSQQSTSSETPANNPKLSKTKKTDVERKHLGESLDILYTILVDYICYFVIHLKSLIFD